MFWIVTFIKYKELTFFLRFYLFLEKGEGKEREKHQCVVASYMPPMGTWPATQACALTGNQTCNPLLHRPILNPLSYNSQGKNWHSYALNLTIKVSFWVTFRGILKFSSCRYSTFLVYLNNILLLLRMGKVSFLPYLLSNYDIWKLFFPPILIV